MLSETYLFQKFQWFRNHSRMVASIVKIKSACLALQRVLGMDYDTHVQNISTVASTAANNFLNPTLLYKLVKHRIILLSLCPAQYFSIYRSCNNSKSQTLIYHIGYITNSLQQNLHIVASTTAIDASTIVDHSRAGKKSHGD